MRRRLLFALLILISTSSFLAGGRIKPTHVQAARQHGFVTVRVGYIPIADFLGLYTAIERGYFQSKGVNVVLTPVSTGSLMLSGMQGGSLDLGLTNSLVVMLAASHGLQSMFVTHGLFEVRANPAHVILVMKTSSIHSAKDLVGKRVAVNSLNTIEHVGMEQWLQDHGGSAVRTRFTALKFPFMVPALVHGQIDAAVAAEPGITIGLGQGVRIIGNVYADEQPRTFLGGMVAFRAWAATHRDTLQRFAAAYREGQVWANTHSTVARTRYLPKYTHLSVALATKIRLSGAFGAITPADLQYWMRLGLRWHVLAHSLDVRQFIGPTASQ